MNGIQELLSELNLIIADLETLAQIEDNINLRRAAGQLRASRKSLIAFMQKEQEVPNGPQLS